MLIIVLDPEEFGEGFYECYNCGEVAYFDEPLSCGACGSHSSNLRGLRDWEIDSLFPVEPESNYIQLELSFD